MDADRARTLLLSLPHVVETAQWGGIVFWVGDKAIGGKMFAMVNPDAASGLVGEPISYHVGPERFAELLERDGLIPAPYMARIFWVAAQRWAALRNAEWEAELTAAHALIYAKLPDKVRAALDLPKPALKALIAERRLVLAVKADTASKAKAAKTQAAKAAKAKMKR